MTFKQFRMNSDIPSARKRHGGAVHAVGQPCQALSPVGRRTSGAPSGSTLWKHSHSLRFSFLHIPRHFDVAALLTILTVFGETDLIFLVVQRHVEIVGRGVVVEYAD